LQPVPHGQWSAGSHAGPSGPERGLTSFAVFVATAYALPIALSLVVGLTGGHESRLIGLAYLSMFLPAISVVVLHSTMGAAPRVDWDRFPLRYLPAALFIIPVVVQGIALPMLAAHGRIEWPDWFTPQADGLYHTPDSRGWGVVTLPRLVARMILNAVVGLAANSFMAFFEEIGWRAWLLPRLWDRIGARGAVIATSVIWALWHTPFQLSGIQHIDGISPARLALAMPFGIFTAGLILGWLWLRTKSIWIVALGHGALNNWGQFAFKFMKDSVTPEANEADGAALRAGFVTLLLVGVLLLWRFVPATDAQSSE
jgi:membrane protease YdiL (CAAX protease family)